MFSLFKYRKDHSGRSRRIKRDSTSTSKKGVAGIRLSILEPPEANCSTEGIDKEDEDDRTPQSVNITTATADRGTSTSIQLRTFPTA